MVLIKQLKLLLNDPRVCDEMIENSPCLSVYYGEEFSPIPINISSDYKREPDQNQNDNDFDK